MAKTERSPIILSKIKKQQKNSNEIKLKNCQMHHKSAKQLKIKFKNSFMQEFKRA